MQQTLNKKIQKCLAVLLLLITCTACKSSPKYVVGDFLNDVAVLSGISDSYDTNDNFIKLKRWGIIDSEDITKISEPLNYYFLCETITRLIEENDDYLTVIKNLGWMDVNAKADSIVSKQEALKIINSAVDYMNNKHIESIYEYDYKDEIKSTQDDLKIGDIVFDENEYKIVEGINDDEVSYRKAEINEIYSRLNISDSFEVNFETAEIIPYESYEVTNYVNNNYNLLASNKNHVFYTDGFRVSYTPSKSGISIHASKDINKVNVFCDLDINSIKPSYKYNFEEDDVKNSYFKIDFNTTETIGASIGRYKKYQLDFRDIDSSSFKGLLDSIVKKEKDEVEATIKVCQIRTPIPNVPTAYFNIDILIKLYVSGKVEMVCYNTHELGFETKNGVLRSICNNEHDLDMIASASAKAALGLNFNLEALSYRLMDLELDGGARSTIRTTMHLYDEEGSESEEEVDLAYSTVDEIASENSNVKICGDLSLNWLFDIIVNTTSTQMFKMGFTKKISILDEDNQIFNNLHHIENGMFVEHCTRKTKKQHTLNTNTNIYSNKIVLESYAEVLDKGSTFKINVTSLPKGYTTNDLIYKSEDVNIANINENYIIANNSGVTKIKVYTKDEKYTSYINVLVRSE